MPYKCKKCNNPFGINESMTIIKDLGAVCEDCEYKIFNPMKQQSTVEERFKEKYEVCETGNFSEQIIPNSNEKESILDFIKSEIHLAEQKAREEGFLDGQVYQNNLRRVNLQTQDTTEV